MADLPRSPRGRGRRRSGPKMPNPRAMERANANARFKRGSAAPTFGFPGESVRPLNRASAPTPTRVRTQRAEAPVPKPPTRAPRPQAPLPALAQPRGLGRAGAPGQLKKAAGVQSARQFAPGQRNKLPMPPTRDASRTSGRVPRGRTPGRM